MSEKDDSDFGTDASLSDVAPPTDDEARLLNQSSEESVQIVSDDSQEFPSDEESEESDDLEDLLQNPFLYPPSHPIPYDRVDDTQQDPDMEFFRAVTTVKVRHEVSDAAIDDMIKVGTALFYFQWPSN